MKIFVTSFSLFLIFWGINLESSEFNRNRWCQAPNMEIEENLNTNFIGLWINIDEEKPSITKCKISYEDNRYIVQMWSLCEPDKECDWGKNETNKVAQETDKFEVLWNSEFAESIMTFEISDGNLKLTNKRIFKDNSGRPENTVVEYFIKQQV